MGGGGETAQHRVAVDPAQPLGDLLAQAGHETVVRLRSRGGSIVLIVAVSTAEARYVAASTSTASGAPRAETNAPPTRGPDVWATEAL